MRIIRKYIPYVMLSSICLMCLYILIATITFGAIPRYGIHPDPSSFGYDYVYDLGSFLLLISFFLLPIWIFVTILSLKSWKQLLERDRTNIFIVLLSIIMFLILKYYAVSTFLWFMD
jgi:hypothetical protein